jgi:DNA primase
MNIMLEYIRTLIPPSWRTSPAGWTSGNCPVCTQNGQARPDTKGRGGFSFNDDKFQYHCFNCGFKTGFHSGGRVNNRLKQLLKAFGASENDIHRLQLEVMREQDVATLLLKQERRQKLVIDWPTVELPEGALPFMDHEEIDTDWINAAEYLTKRGFDIEDDRLQFSFSKAPARMNKRFIIPFYYQGRVVGYTARWVGKTPEGMPKYYNQQPPKNFVYGLDRQTADKQIVIVTEGQLDAIVTDGIAIGSNKINEDQADIIHSLQKHIVVLPDADKPGMAMVDAAIENNWSVAFPEWEDCKDAGDALTKYGKLYTMRSILDSIVTNPTKIQVLAKKYCK